MQLSSESHKYISFLTKNYQNRNEINFENPSFKRNIKQIFHDVSQGSKWVSQNFDENTSIKQMATYILKLKSNLDLYQEISENSKHSSLKYSQENAKQMVLK